MIILSVSFLSIFLLGFQQQCVIHGNYKAVALNSFAIAFAQFHLYRAAVDGSGYDWLLMGLGGTLGITLSMYIHRRYFNQP